MANLKVLGIFRTNYGTRMVEIDSQIGVVSFNRRGDIFYRADVEGSGMTEDRQDDCLVLFVWKINKMPQRGLKRNMKRKWEAKKLTNLPTKMRNFLTSSSLGICPAPLYATFDFAFWPLSPSVFNPVSRLRELIWSCWNNSLRCSNRFSSLVSSF